jgi:hypothetical protein
MRDFGRRLDDLDPEFMGLGLVFGFSKDGKESCKLVE